MRGGRGGSERGGIRWWVGVGWHVRHELFTGRHTPVRQRGCLISPYMKPEADVRMILSKGVWHGSCMSRCGTQGKKFGTVVVCPDVGHLLI